MDSSISSSTFSEKEININISKNNNSSRKNAVIVDIKNYKKKIKKIPLKRYKTKSKKVKLRFCFKKLGHTLCLLSDKMGNPIIMIGPNWTMYVYFCGFIVLGYSLFFYGFWKKLNLFFKIAGIFSFSLYFISYTGTFLLNPGYPERDENSLLGIPRIKFKYCNECKIWERVDRKISHCNDCGVCVEGYDHHCPWTGKCIGRKTIFFFNTFLYLILGIILFFLLAVIYIDFDRRNK